MNQDEQQPLEKDPVWSLLAKARKVEVDPFFSRNVLRAVRQLEQEKACPWAVLRSLFTLPRLATAAAIVVCGAAAFHFLRTPPATGAQGADSALVADSGPADEFITHVADTLAMLDNGDSLALTDDPVDLEEADLPEVLF